MKIKEFIKKTLPMLLLAGIASCNAQKKTHTFQVERIIPASAERVWETVGVGFANVSDYHGGIVKSELINGSTKSEVGCERICQLDNDGKKYVKEKLTAYNPSTMSFKAQLYSSTGVPTVPEYTYAKYKVEPINENSCKVIITQVYRTKPAFLGSIAKRQFVKYTEDQLVFIEHYTLTGEAVTKENQKEIKKKYKSQG